MVRDSEEWRRPWAEGDVALPAVRASEGPATLYAAGLDGAFDVVDDSMAALVSPSMAALRKDRSPDSSGPQPALAAAAAAAAPVVRTARGRDHRVAGTRGRGLLTGVLGGAAGAMLVILGLGALGIVDVDLDRIGSQSATIPVAPAPAPGAGRAPLPDPGSGAAVIPDVADRVLPTVVRINVSGSVDLSGSGALGSGVIYRSDGFIITNHHVIEGAAAVEVLLANGDRLEAEIVGSDVLNDLAVLRVDRTGLPAIDLRPDDEPLRVGETVVAIGSPFGLDATVTSGIISALNRDLRVPNGNDVIPAVIQTDAAINPGNSGGALVDLQGRLVGINTAIVSRTGVNQGVGFAVSVQQAVASSDQLIAQGFVRYPLLGITGTDVSAEVAQLFGLENRRGAVVDTVQPGSGADAGGMRVGDVIVAVDGVPLRSMSELVAEVRRRVPGARVVFDVLRGAAPVRVEVVLGERPRS
jgi:S1-C subfamily serine protease